MYPNNNNYNQNNNKGNNNLGSFNFGGTSQMDQARHKYTEIENAQMNTQSDLQNILTNDLKGNYQAKQNPNPDLFEEQKTLTETEQLIVDLDENKYQKPTKEELEDNPFNSFDSDDPENTLQDNQNKQEKFKATENLFDVANDTTQENTMLFSKDSNANNQFGGGSNNVFNFSQLKSQQKQQQQLANNQFWSSFNSIKYSRSKKQTSESQFKLKQLGSQFKTIKCTKKQLRKI